MEIVIGTYVVMYNLLSKAKRIFAKRISSVLKKGDSKERRILFLIMIVSTFLRLYQFPSLPAGLQWDEVSAGYETYALLLHGTDRWGNPFPVYFPSWGSGQNVLLSYLNMPFIAIFGLTAFGERLSSVLLSLLTMGIFYVFIKRWYRTRTALIAAFLLGTSPWDIMISRWSLESNLLPSFLLLGITFLSYCYTSRHSRTLMPFSLFFIALAFYAYGVSIIIIPIFLVLYFGLLSLQRLAEVLKLHRKATHDLSTASILLKTMTGRTCRNTFGIFLSFLIFFLVASPFFLFILDNYILHTTPWIVQHLPLTIPLLISNRLAQVAGGQNSLASNTQFLVSGFDDGTIWNMARGYPAFGLLSFPLVAIGIYYSLRRRQVHANLFLIWLVATIPLFFLFPLNIVRANALFLPLIALSAIGISGLYGSIGNKATKTAVLSLLLAILALYNGTFCVYYLNTYNHDLKGTLNAGFDTALLQARSAASANEPIYISHWITFNYVYTLFFLKADPVDFQKHSRVLASGGIYQVLHYRNYYFDSTETELTLVPSFVAILKDNERLNCEDRTTLYSEGDWTIVRCFNR